MRHTLICNKIIDRSDVVGASPVGAAPTTSSFSTEHLASMAWAKATARRDEKHFKFLDLVQLILEVWRYVIVYRMWWSFWKSESSLVSRIASCTCCPLTVGRSTYNSSRICLRCPPISLTANICRNGTDKWRSVVLRKLYPDTMWSWQDILLNIDGLVHKRHDSIVNALELCLSCTNPSTWCYDMETIYEFHPLSLLWSLLDSPHKGPVMQSFGVLLVVSLK